MVGRTIGKYRIVEQIGRGGMGTVYKAIDETLDRFVAIKMLNADLMAPKSMERFRAEAITIARLNHPRIATLYELTREGDDLLMVMEYISGETCEKLAARMGPLPVPLATSICGQALDALEHAHNAGIVHRDLKPSNLMLTPSGDVKVMDFGIARAAGAEHLTFDGFMMGTPAYMAPEQVRGEEVDRRMDLYAMAVVLYKLLAGRLPHEGDTAFALIHAQMSGEPPPAREFRPDLPEWIDPILARGLAKSPADRFQTAAEFREALEKNGVTTPIPASVRFDQAETLGPTPTPVSVRMPAVLPPPPRPTGTEPRIDTVTLRKPHLAAAGGLLALLIIAVGVLAFVTLRRPLSVAPAASPTTVSSAAPSTGSDVLTVEPIREAAPAPAAPITPAPVTPAPPSPATTPRNAATASDAPKAASAKPATAPPANTPGVDRRSSSTPSAAAAGRTTVLPATTSSPSAPPITDGRTESFGDVRALILEGTKDREIDALLGLEPGQLVVRNRKNGTVISSLQYQSITAATYSLSKRPRWKEDGTVVPIPDALGGGGFFLSTSKHWLALQSKTDFVIVRLDDRNVQPVLSAIESRTSVKIERLRGNEPTKP